MTAYVSLLETTILGDLRAFLLNYLPAGIEVIRAQTNRTPEPVGADFVVMTPVWRDRLETNIDSFVDCSFLGTTSGTVLTVSAMLLGQIGPGAAVPKTFSPPIQFFGLGVPDNSLITGQLTGIPGGIGTYSITPSQTTSPAAIGTFNIGNSQIGGAVGAVLACGAANLLQPTHLIIQLDVHGPNSPDNSQIITTLLRDEIGWDFFAALGNGVFPLYGDEARQMPFENDQQQIEERWVIDAHLQANIVVLLPQQFATTITVIPKDVDVVFPPS